MLNIAACGRLRQSPLLLPELFFIYCCLCLAVLWYGLRRFFMKYTGTAVRPKTMKTSRAHSLRSLETLRRGEKIHGPERVSPAALRLCARMVLI
jgi:hypothetical protein